MVLSRPLVEVDRLQESLSQLEEKLKDLKSRREKVEKGGGAARIERQHKAGKMTARERIAAFFDPGTFVEIDAFVTHRAKEFGMDKVEAPGEGVVTGYGLVNGRAVCVAAQDFTVIGGSLGEMHAQKITKCMDLAARVGIPFVFLNDSGGARIQEGVDALKGYGEIFYRNVKYSGVIPQISVILGPCAGGAVYSPALTDFIFMVSGISNMFITGPQVIKAVTGEEVTVEQLGGAAVHNQVSGVAQFMAPDEKTCFDMVKTLLSYLPSNNQEDPPYVEPQDDPGRLEPSLREVVPVDPNKGYNMYDVINLMVDDGVFFEVARDFAANIITGFARLNGRVVGIVASQPQVKAGCLDIDASDKASRFVRFCDAFNIPLVTLVDVPGYLPGVDQEYGGIIRHGAKLLYAYSEATVPKVTVITRKAYGGAYIAMCSRHLGADMVFAFPTAEIAVMGPEGAANVVFKDEIAAAENPEEKRKEKIKEFRDVFANPYVAASRGYVDDVIDPQELRPKVIGALELTITKRPEVMPKKHGNMPV
ncbi:MAG TPA: methylmalonyl-CoA carboxyltransferase [Firmicutes bacterium]|nr:methylmalonyl-CoA carboxyltransferase [Candidatus Fermentithermobacillaceae bacterium]